MKSSQISLLILSVSWCLSTVLSSFRARLVMSLPLDPLSDTRTPILGHPVAQALGRWKGTADKHSPATTMCTAASTASWRNNRGPLCDHPGYVPYPWSRRVISLSWLPTSISGWTVSWTRWCLLQERRPGPWPSETSPQGRFGFLLGWGRWWLLLVHPLASSLANTCWRTCTGAYDCCWDVTIWSTLDSAAALAASHLACRTITILTCLPTELGVHMC